MRSARPGGSQAEGNTTYRTEIGPIRIVPDFFQSLLVVAPHPDDEVIGAGGLIHAMRQLGRHVRVVVASDGAASHPGSKLFRPAALAALRRTESITALASLGVARDDIHFCDFPDGQSVRWASDPHGVARMASAVHGRFDLVCLPSEHDDHPDHRMTRDLARRFMTGGGLNLSYCVWPTACSRADTRTVAEHALSPESHAAKRTALRAYRSQLGAITDDPSGFTIDADTFDRFTAPVERFTL